MLPTPLVLLAISGSVSVVACVSMMVCFVLFEESRRCGRRILFYLHATDLLGAVLWLLTLLPEIASPPTPITSTPWTCYVQVHAGLKSGPSSTMPLVGLWSAVLRALVVSLDDLLCLSLVPDSRQGQQDARGEPSSFDGRFALCTATRCTSGATFCSRGGGRSSYRFSTFVSSRKLIVCLVDCPHVYGPATLWV